MADDGRVDELSSRAEALLAGPRGRELCACLATGLELWDIREWFWPTPCGGAPAAARAAAGPQAVAELLRRKGQRRAPASGFSGPLAAVAALADVTETADYWGEPAAGDQLGDPAVTAELRGAAVTVAEAAGCQWWWSGLDRGAQRHVQWTGRDAPPPSLDDAAQMLRRAAAEAAENERGMSRDRDKPAGSGAAGPWWSHPWPGAISTTRRLDGLEAVLLAGQEDSFGDTEAVTWPLAVASTARVYEIDGPAAWQRLAAAYPRAATATYRHTWAWTGWDGEWIQPDWPAVARDWDGVHLTIAGYLATAGRALPAGPARTLLAGWNPDETYWLADVLSPSGEPQTWDNPSHEPLGWTATHTATAHIRHPGK